jgi:hypothetical protein
MKVRSTLFLSSTAFVSIIMGYSFLMNDSKAHQACVSTRNGEVVCGELQQNRIEPYNMVLTKETGEWIYSDGRPSDRPVEWDVVEVTWDRGTVINITAIEAQVQTGWGNGCTDTINVETSDDNDSWRTVITQRVTTRSSRSGWAWTNLNKALGNFQFRYIKISERVIDYGRACALDDARIVLHNQN